MTHAPVKKMFGALVLGSGALLTVTHAPAHPTQPVQPDSDIKNKAHASGSSQVAPPKAQPKTQPKTQLKPQPTTQLKSRTLSKSSRLGATTQYCQTEFTFYEYHRDGSEETVTCLDDKSEAEILKIITEAKKSMCKSAFCGCWLG